jgi:hypothetical protein
MYTSADETLYVYSLSDFTSPPIGTYVVLDDCSSGLIADNYLFLGSSNNIIVYEISTSLTEPLK